MTKARVKQIELTAIFSIFLFFTPLFVEAVDCSNCWCLRPDGVCEHHTKKDAPGDGTPITTQEQCNEYCYSRTTGTDHWQAVHCDATYIDWKTKDMSDPCFAKVEAPTEEAGGTTIFFTEEPRLQVPDFNVKFSDIKVTKEGETATITISWLAEYIAAVYKYLVGVATILSIVMIMYGGFRWITAAGDAGKIGEAKKTINGAVIGLFIALGSYTILNLINPDLVSFRSLQMAVVQRVPLTFDAQLSLETGGFDAETYDETAELIKTGDKTAADTLADTCKPDPGTYEGRIANLKDILPLWLAVCKKNCAYIKGGFTNGCKTASGTKRMAKYMYESLASRNLSLPASCNTADLAKSQSCYGPIAQAYRTEIALPACNAGMVIGDCITWSHQLLNCAGKTKLRIPQYRSGKAGQESYLVFAADGIDAAIAELNKKGGLKYGDVFWSEAFGHNYMYIDTNGPQIVEMGGFGSSGVDVPGVTKPGKRLNTVKVHPFEWYLKVVRQKEKEAPKKDPPRTIKTYIYRPYDY